MKQIISALFLCMLLSAVPGLQAQNIQLHYDFGRSLYAVSYTHLVLYQLSYSRVCGCKGSRNF